MYIFIEGTLGSLKTERQLSLWVVLGAGKESLIDWGEKGSASWDEEGQGLVVEGI